MTKAKTVLVLGGYGLIGAACLRALKVSGFRVIGVGRSPQAARACAPQTEWLIRDIATTTAAQWREDLAGVDVVVNAAGALQNGARDNLVAIHEDALRNLTEALKDSKTRFIQISAAGADTAASTAFFRTKARGDHVLMQSVVDWVILRPTLVIGPQAYGGTALLRAAAALPLINLQMMPQTPVQTVSLNDVADAVVLAARGEITSRTLADLTESNTQTFDQVTRKMRMWLGFAPWKIHLPLPNFFIRAVGYGADMLGWLGWRSPLRSTALRVLETGISGNPQAWLDAGGRPCTALDQTLALMPATTQERWFARLYLMLPLSIAILSTFWLASGLIGFAKWPEALALLTDRDMPRTSALFAVLGGALADTMLGAAVLIRRFARTACLAMVALSLGYLAGGTIWAIDLWSDPLGPLVKVLPAIGLALFTAAILEDR